MALTQITSDVISSNAISATMIANGSITSAHVANNTITSAHIVSVSNTAITGNITSGQITSIANTQITGNITSSQIATSAQYMGFKNRIINGGMTIDQRNAGASVTLTNSSTYLLDRYFVNRIGGAATFACQQSTTVPAGFKNSFSITVGTGAVPSGSDEGCLVQCIEGLNISDLGFGTANAKTFTLSFWVRSSVIGTYGVTFFNSAFNRSYVTSYTISVANTWEQKTITVAGDTSGTWLTTNGRGICVSWDLGTGSTYSAAASSSWQAGGYEGLTGGTKLASTAGATWYITGVQLEVGSQATSFDFRSITQETALCQRYYFKSNTSGSNTFGFGGFCYDNSTCLGTGKFAVTMRTSPTITITNTDVIYVGSMGSPVATRIGVEGFSNIDHSTGSSAGKPAIAGYTASAEL